jgi:hypothetical protein
LPADFEAVMDDAWQNAHDLPGYLGELESRALGLLAAGAPGPASVGDQVRAVGGQDRPALCPLPGQQDGLAGREVSPRADPGSEFSFCCDSR